VCDGDTGHAEVVQLHYDPDQVAYEHLLDVFFASHDPTQLNRQGNDVGDQYRSTIIVQDEEQRSKAEAKIAALQKPERYDGEVKTTVEGPATFYPAEDYHQDYFAKNPNAPYCRVVIEPKLDKFEQWQRKHGGG